MARIRRAVLGVLRICAITAAAAFVLFPLYSRKDQPALLTGAGIAAVAVIRGNSALDPAARTKEGA